MLIYFLSINKKKISFIFTELLNNIKKSDWNGVQINLLLCIKTKLKYKYKNFILEIFLKFINVPEGNVGNKLNLIF